MGLVRIHTSHNLAEMAVLQSELDAAGVFNYLQTYHYGTIDALTLIALGGQRMYICEEDVDYVRDYIMARQAITDYDPIAERKYGMWKRATIFGIARGFLLPILFIQSSILIGLAFLFSLMALSAVVQDMTQISATLWSLSAACGFFGLMLYHAKNIALPQIQSRKKGH